MPPPRSPQKEQGSRRQRRVCECCLKRHTYIIISRPLRKRADFMGRINGMSVSLNQQKIAVAFAAVLALFSFYPMTQRVNQVITTRDHQWKQIIKVDNTTNIINATGQHSDFCQTVPQRCAPISVYDDYISYLHISKCSGSSWVQEWKKLKGIPLEIRSRKFDFTSTKLYPLSPAGAEHSLSYQDAMLQRQLFGHSSTSTSTSTSTSPGKSPSILRFLTLRNPRQHVWSLFNMCFQAEWGKRMTQNTNFPRNHPQNMLLDFRTWLQHFANTTTIHRHMNAFGCYHPANYQSRALAKYHANPHNVFGQVWEPALSVVKRQYWSLDGVSLTGFFHESKCLLYYRIQLANQFNNSNTKNNSTTNFYTNQDFQATFNTMVDSYLEHSCRCVGAKPKSKWASKWASKDSNTMTTMTTTIPAATTTTSPTESASASASASALLEDVKITYASETHRSTMTDVPSDILQLIDVLTQVDQKIYRIALQQFIDEIHWMETKLGRQVLCDSVVQQWEPELDYLNLNLTSLYYHI